MKIKNRPECIIRTSMEGIEFFAISNEGLVVSDPKSIQGKAKRVEPKSTFFQTLWERDQPQLLAGIWRLVGFYRLDY